LNLGGDHFCFGRLVGAEVVVADRLVACGEKLTTGPRGRAITCSTAAVGITNTTSQKPIDLPPHHSR